MAKKQELEITVANNGEVRISVSGVDGPGCLKLTADIEEELGVVILREKKSEYYKQDTGRQQTINLEKTGGEK